MACAEAEVSDIVWKMRLVGEFCRTRLKDCESADAYVVKLTNVAKLVAKLDEVGLNVSDTWQIAILLYGLPPSYMPMTLSVQSRDDVTPEIVKTQILQAEQWLAQGDAAPGDVFWTSRDERFKKVSYNNRGGGNPISSRGRARARGDYHSTRGYNNGNNNVKCYNC